MKEQAVEKTRCDKLVYRPPGGSLASTRNARASAASGNIIAFTDDGCVAEAGWLKALMSVYEDPDVVAAGGSALPEFPEGRPRLLPERWDWLAGAGPYYDSAQMLRST
jgi:hypothetical protein